MDKGFDIREYDLFDILNMLKLPYEFQATHLADLKKKNKFVKSTRYFFGNI